MLVGQNHPCRGESGRCNARSRCGTWCSTGLLPARSVIPRAASHLLDVTLQLWKHVHFGFVSFAYTENKQCARILGSSVLAPGVSICSSLDGVRTHTVVVDTGLTKDESLNIRGN